MRCIVSIIYYGLYAPVRFLSGQIPEGLVVAIPEMEVLIEEIDALYVEHAGPNSGSKTLSRKEVQERLTDWSAALLASLPAFIQEEVSRVFPCGKEGFVSCYIIH